MFPRMEERQMGKRKTRKRNCGKRPAAFFLAALLLSMKLVPCLAAFPWQALAAQPGDTVIAYGSGFHHYCIDGAGANRALIDGDEYVYILPSETLSREETAIVFWGMLTLQAGFGNMPQINAVIRNINAGASAAGLQPISKFVTEADLKLLIHSSAVRAKYPWLKSVLANEERYLQLAGLLGGGSGNESGNGSSGLSGVPSVLQGHTTPGNPYILTVADGEAGSSEGVKQLRLPFDESGADADFIRSVPLLFSATGADGSFSPVLPEGWVCQKTDTEILLTSTSNTEPALYLMFDVRGTRYGTGGSFSSVEEVYEQSLQIWRCSRCAGTHKQMYNGAAPLAAHQRLAFIELQAPEVCYYAAAGRAPVSSGNGSMEFEVYRHEEDWVSTYNVRLRKYDHETGKTLENAVFSLYERFDDKAEIRTDRDGAVTIYAGGAPYKSYHKDSPVTWEDFRFVSALMTDENGEAEKTIEHGYHYDKTFCDGHPAPEFVPVPEEEEDEESGETENQDEIEAAQEENRRLARLWLDTEAACSAWASGAFFGVHFHWIMLEVDEREIQDIAESGGETGGTPSAGETGSAAGARAFSDSGCETDAGETYEKFISLKYSYAITEDTAREGYTLHGNHTDDLPIEVITTDASENGANAAFAGIYGQNIRVNGAVGAEPAAKVMEARKQAEEGTLSHKVPDVKKKRIPLLQRLLQIFTFHHVDEIPLTDDREPEKMLASASDAGKASEAKRASLDADETGVASDKADMGKASGSNAEKPRMAAAQTATPSEADTISVTLNLHFPDKTSISETYTSIRGQKEDGGAASEYFTDAYNSALHASSSGSDVPAGPSGNYSHCGNADGEENWWRIYDHRTEGELHINKRDMDLKEGESADYDSYGDSQGDAVLEGAVYGLFAAEDLVHPDGKTGIVYHKNDLTAVAATDKNGDASFLVYTEEPGMTYRYDLGQIMQRGEAGSSPGNLYDRAHSEDDYAEDGIYTRDYADNKGINGNCWIGRPLLMGNYYVKELSRSEGYELSVGNRKHPLTNAGQDFSVSAEESSRDGYAVITEALYAEQQVRSGATGAYGDPTFGELFFTVESKNSGGYDLVFSGLPAGARLYRLDTAEGTEPVQVGTGTMVEIPETDWLGNPVYAVTEYEGQYPRYDVDGKLLTRERPVSRKVQNVEMINRKGLDEARCEALLSQAENGMDETAVLEKLAAPFTLDEQNFVKYKLERILRAHGKGTPRRVSDGSSRYTTLEDPAYDTGFHNGTQIRYGAPVITLQIPQRQENRELLTAGDLLAALLNYYQENSQYSYGGIDRIREEKDFWSVDVYAGRTGNPECFFAPETDTQPAAFYRRTAYVPDDPAEPPRYLYAVYTEKEQEESFGVYTEFAETAGSADGGSRRVSAVLMPDAAAEPDGTLVTRYITENMYYQPGEIPLDADGNRIPKVRYEEEMVDGETRKQYTHWTELAWTQDSAVHVESSYTDFYGNPQDDSNGIVWKWKLVLPGAEQITLSQEDAELLAGEGAQWVSGDQMGAASYWLMVKHVKVQAYLDYKAGQIGNENSYVRSAALVYPGQAFVWQDGAGVPGNGTGKIPVSVEERIIRQKIRVGKRIEATSYRNTDSYADIHEDLWTKQYDKAEAVENFRFKVYLKSNLKDLYRDEAGVIIWQDRHGNERTYEEQRQANEQFPEKVNRIYTKVLHQTEPLFKNSCDAVTANTALYAYEGGVIREDAQPGYSAILETVEALVEDGADTRTVRRLNYEKFFDAIETANHDKWDDAAPEYTSFRPLGNAVNRRDETVRNTLVSDRVRQFAIDWYLDDEIAKLTDAQGAAAEGAVSFTDEIFDVGLYQAIQKAQNYLKPFFAYDLDELYAIAWDSEGGGGADGDATTLCANQKPGGALAQTGYYGISAALPYGTYVIAEQQPKYADLEDFKNRHYETDRPQEISLPAVYADGEEGAQASPGNLDSFYNYKAAYTAQELEQRYQIRFLEESHVIRAHSSRGDFEVYKYGLDLDYVQNGVPEHPGEGDYFAMTQSEYRPFQNSYNEQDDRNAGAVSYYLSEGQSGRDAVAEVYRYSSLSEHSGLVDAVAYPGGEATEDNVPGIVYRDQVAVMQGAQTAYDSRYAPMLVPYAVTEEESSEESSCRPYGCAWFCNRLFTSRIRIEKLDSATHENILHDGAVFHIYAASRDDSPDGEGRVLFYEKDTQIQGTKAFLTEMGARDIRPVLRGPIAEMWNRVITAAARRTRKTAAEYEAGNTEENPTEDRVGYAGENVALTDLHTGIVSAGTPVCEEGEQVILGDRFGLQTGAMKAFATVRDGQMAEASSELQTTGYLNTPQPLSAGAYVLCEIRPPAGYVRTKPVALELYSDQITYYQNGNRDKRIIAAVYEDPADEQTANGNKPQDQIHTARIYIENEPIRLQVEKRTVPDEQGNSGFVSGAKMTLFDAVALNPSGDSQDFSYEGLVVERSDAGHVVRMYVKEGFGGEKTEFLPERDAEILEAEGYIWNAVTVSRPDTDILYYDLSDLDIQITPETDGKDGRYRAFAWKGASRFLEFSGGDLTEITYDAKDHVLHVGAGTHVYHLGKNGERDALVDPYTGMAYVVSGFDGTNGSWDQIRGKDGTGAESAQVFVWPVNIRRDEYGNIISRDKITTSRAALSGAGEQSYLTGSWQAETDEASHRESTLRQNPEGNNLNEEILLGDNNGSFEKRINPVYDRHGLAVYYPKSGEIYDKEAELYDRNNDPVRVQDTDGLEAYNHAAYAVKEHAALHDSREKLEHRLGEAYVTENTWITSESHPNDPFTQTLTEGSGDILERVPAGCYIMEEVQAPDGFARALPMAVQVQETDTVQTVTMTDETIKTEFSKTDGVQNGENSVFACGYVKSATLGLWKEEDQPEQAEPVRTWTTGEEPYKLEQLPAGRYLWKELEVPSGFVSREPISITVYDRSEVQCYEMPEEHTRVEIEKYCLENGKDQADGEIPVGGAGFTLYPAVLDADGNVCYADGKPQYDAAQPAASWVTDDGTMYQGFPDAFEEMYLEHGARPGSSVKWDAGTVLHRADYEAAYRKKAVKAGQARQWIFVYKTESGQQIRIGVTEEPDSMADHAYRFEYQFNWQKLSDINEYACTYLTVQNRQRFDYLPVHESYVLVETEVPPGFTRAENVLIRVEDTGAVQEYRVENTEGTLLISKVYEHGAKELPGVRLALYRADETGGFTRSRKYLFDAWVTGSDGRYSELDALNQRIPDGYAEGDFRPHRVRRLPDGVYWLAEQECPGYYTTLEPVQIVYEWQPEIRVVRVSNRLVTGMLELRKTDSSGHPLDGAVFELAAYETDTLQKPWEQKKEDAVFCMQLTAPVQKTGLPVGTVREDGSVQPFWYELREIQAPDGYELNPEVFRWQFAPDTGAGPYPWNGSAHCELTVTDRKEPETPEPEEPEPETPEPETPEPEQPEPEQPKPEKPDRPEHDRPQPTPVQRIGRILAWYHPESPDDAGWFFLGPDGKLKIRLPQMGDGRRTGLLCGVFVLSAAGVILLCRKKRGNKDKTE